jgi:hypothetical protein
MEATVGWRESMVEEKNRAERGRLSVYACVATAPNVLQQATARIRDALERSVGTGGKEGPPGPC